MTALECVLLIALGFFAPALVLTEFDRRALERQLEEVLRWRREEHLG